MICSTKIIKIRTRVWKKLVKTRNLYGFQSLSETIDYLLGNDKVNKLLEEAIVEEARIQYDPNWHHHEEMIAEPIKKGNK